MTARDDSSEDTQLSAAPESAPAVSNSEGSQAVAEGAKEAVDPSPASEGLESPAPALDESAATPDRPAPAEAVAGASDERPELFVAGAFVGGLVLALLLRRVASG